MVVSATKFVIFLALVACSSGQKSCFKGRNSQQKTSATKTPYSFIAQEDASEISLPGCSAAQFWIIVRHGTRYPSKAGLRAITQRLPEMLREIRGHEKNELCEDVLESMEKWIPDVDMEQEKYLHAEGELEMLLLSERFQLRFPKLLSSDYHQELFSFRATNNERAVQSQKFFASGLFGRNVRVEYQEPVNPHDPVIRSYKVCGKWQKEVKKNPDSLKERILFEESEFFYKNVRTPVSKRLGYDDVIKLDDIDALYNGCVFGQAWKPKSIAPWCKVFTQRELDILEYREDLEYFWQDGYGYDISRKQLCVLMQDLAGNSKTLLRDVASEENGVFYLLSLWDAPQVLCLPRVVQGRRRSQA